LTTASGPSISDPYCSADSTKTLSPSRELDSIEPDRPPMDVCGNRCAIPHSHPQAYYCEKGECPEPGVPNHPLMTPRAYTAQPLSRRTAY
jgi:hypothetical protein